MRPRFAIRYWWPSQIGRITFFLVHPDFAWGATTFSEYGFLFSVAGRPNYHVQHEFPQDREQRRGTRTCGGAGQPTLPPDEPFSFLRPPPSRPPDSATRELPRSTIRGFAIHGPGAAVRVRRFRPARNPSRRRRGVAQPTPAERLATHRAAVPNSLPRYAKRRTIPVPSLSSSYQTGYGKPATPPSTPRPGTPRQTKFVVTAYSKKRYNSPPQPRFLAVSPRVEQISKR